MRPVRMCLDGVVLAHGTQTPLSAELRPAALTALMGPNGAGKSTLIRTLVGLSMPRAGQVHINGQPLGTYTRSELARIVALVLTDSLADVATSAAEFVALGRVPYTGWWRRLDAADRAAVDAALAAVGLDGLAARALNTLSDGERQRAAIARALAQATPVLMLDEAIAFLDMPGKLAVLDLLRTQAHIHKRTVLLATHDLDFAREFADELWLLDPNEPLLRGAPEELALCGGLERLFAGAPVRFDAPSGRVCLNERPPCASVALSGEEPARSWTLHALKRIGIDHDPASPHRVQVRGGTAPQWMYQAEATATERTFNHLADLITMLLEVSNYAARGRCR